MPTASDAVMLHYMKYSKSSLVCLPLIQITGLCLIGPVELIRISVAVNAS